MTVPTERYNSINNAREFLRSLLDPKLTPRVPKAIRRQAYWALRHFPSVSEMSLIASNDTTGLINPFEAGLKSWDTKKKR